MESNENISKPEFSPASKRECKSLFFFFAFKNKDPVPKVLGDVVASSEYKSQHLGRLKEISPISLEEVASGIWEAVLKSSRPEATNLPVPETSKPCLPSIEKSHSPPPNKMSISGSP
ncbi:hypothetical protein HWI79_2458 [Cryptosporidium felis]|nr:hypothetical protein HWI79_2458 [Cryptosporidium felis]